MEAFGFINWEDKLGDLYICFRSFIHQDVGRTVERNQNINLSGQTRSTSDNERGIQVATVARNPLSKMEPG